MDIKKLIRDPARVLACIKETPDKRVIALKPVKIHIPARFTEKHLAVIGTETYIVGIYAMIVEDTYFASSTVNAMMQITPSSMVRVLIDDTEYIEFQFDAGATIIKSTELVKSGPLVYRIYDEFWAKGKVPWYLGYVQMGEIYRTAKYHAGANLGENPEVSELVVAMLARNPNDRTQSYRTSLKSLEDLERKPPAFIPLRSVQFAADNTMNKLAGSYFQEGVISALNSPSDKVERIESLLRR